jgi:hypothetical protein
MVIVQWNRRRTQASASGIDPDTVELSFTDALDSVATIVAPRSFQLRRSKNRPLLFSYQIQLVELRDVKTSSSLLDTILAAFSNPLRWLAGVTGLGNVINQIQYYANKAMSVFGTISTGIQTFLATGTSLIGSVASMAQQVRGQFDSTVSALLTVGQSYAEAGANAFAALAGGGTLSAQDRLPAMAISSQFQDAACIMATGFNARITYPVYDGLDGASSCSSTGGGGPASLYTESLQNPFYSAVATAAPPVMATTPAVQAIAVLRGDPLALSAGGTAQIGGLLAAAGNGVRVAA